MRWFGKKRRVSVEFEDVLVDSSSLSPIERERMERRIELPIANRNIYLVGALFLLIATSFYAKIFSLQMIQGASFRDISQNNSVDKAVIIAERGVIYDRNDEMLAWNEVDYNGDYDFPIRAYSDREGLGQLLGYVSYPQRDSHGFYFRTDYVGRTGAELAYGDELEGTNGKQIVEVDALGDVVAEHVIEKPTSGEAVKLSVDAELSEVMYQIIATSTAQAGFRSGAGAIMDLHTGEVIALASYPSYDPEVMADGDDFDLIDEYNNDDRFPFLNKVIGGAYAPGSVVKPFVAYAALAEKAIDPMRTIVSNGSITIPNPYNPSQPSEFNDWRAHGKMTMREAIAFSSNVYFYIAGGGLPKIALPQAGVTEPIEGVGVTKLYQYFTMFGFGQSTGEDISSEQIGVVPNPEWKEKTFHDDWRLGDTYFTSIGQYGWLATPLQIIRAYAALGNGGTLLTPHFIYGEEPEGIDLELNPDYLDIIHEGMRKTVIYPGGTARSLERKDVAIAAKSGTAEVGTDNAHVNSWAAGFWPYEDPQYAFVMMMDRAPRSNRLGATTIMGHVFDWMAEHRPEYLGLDVEQSDE